MKAQVYDEIETLMDVQSEFRNRIIPKGTHGTVVERYEYPREGYAVDLALPDDTQLDTGFDFENVVLFPDQFVVVPTARRS